MVSRYTSGTYAVPAFVLAALLWCCSVHVVSAQSLVLAFSTTATAGTDGFNNGVFLLPSSSSVPVAIGLFDAQSGLPTSAPGTLDLSVEIVDQMGQPHSLLSLYGASTATLQAGAVAAFFNTGLRWRGMMPTTATVRVRDVGNVLPPVEVMVIFDPSLPGNVHIIAQIVEDRNGNRIHDAADVVQTDTRLRVCQIGGMFLNPRPDGIYRLDIPGYTGGFPLRLLPADRPEWRSAATGGMEGLVVEGYGTYQLTYLVQRVQPSWIWSGVVHRTTGQLVCNQQDSSLVVTSFQEGSELAMELQAAAWRMTSMITPSDGTTASLSLSFYGGPCYEEEKTGELSIICEDDREIVTPLLGTPYDLLIYRDGVLVYTDNGRLGPAVSLKRTVRRWFARDGAFGVEELQGADLIVVGGPVLKADSVIIRVPGNGLIRKIGRIVCAGKGVEELEIFDHETKAFGFYHRPFGTLLPAHTFEKKLATALADYHGGMRIAFPRRKVSGFTFEWGPPVAAGGDPQVILSAGGSEDVFTRRLGAVVLDKVDLRTVIRALPLSGPWSTGEVQVQLFLAGTNKVNGTASGSTVASCGVWPYRAGVDVGTGIAYSLQWREPVIVQLADGRVVECDELRLVYPTTVPSIRALSDIEVELKRCGGMPVHEDWADTVLPAMPLTTKITFTGEVYNDKDASSSLSVGEPGRPGRVVVFTGDPLVPAQVAYATTNSLGLYSIDFDPMVQGWAPERISIVSQPGWARTTGDYDLVLLGMCDQSMSNVDFGEIREGTGYPDEQQQWSGIYDDFAIGEIETSDPQAGLALQIENYGHDHIAAYDAMFRNRFFLHTFEEIRPDGCVLTEATLLVRLQAVAGDAYNDRIILQTPGARFWNKDLSELAAENVWYKGRTSDVTLDLEALPLGTAMVNALPYLQAGQFDLIINDDTQIDYALLTVGFACPMDDPILTGVADDRGITSELKVFPNPSTGTGTVVFTLPHRETVTIIVYDIMNREVARLLNGVPLSAGRQVVSFVLPSLAGGMYTLSVRAGEHSRMQSLWIGP